MKIKSILLIKMFFAAATFLSAQGLKVEPGTCIKIESGSTLNISGGRNLFIESDASGDASLIDLGNVTYTGGGEGKVKQYLSNGKWHLISIPVASAVAGMFEGDYLQAHSEITNLWTDIPDVLFNLQPSKGYALWTVDAAATTELFTGSTNTGNKSSNFTRGGQGFNLVGNPYPSALDWDNVTFPPQLSAAIWLFDPTMGASGDYRYYIPGGGGANTTTSNIPACQGFFIRAGGSGTLTFKNSDRRHSGQGFYKAEGENEMLVLKATGNNITTQTAIRFISESTPQIDRLFDVNKIISNSADVPVVYTLCEGEKMAINSLPQISGYEAIPVYFEAGTDGSYSFTATELESLGELVPVFLEDVSLSYVQNLRLNSTYNFGYSTGTVKEFIVHFKDVTGIDNLAADTPLFHCKISNNILAVNYLGNGVFDGPATVDVYNLAGQRLISAETSNALNELPFHCSSAMYIVHIQYNKTIYSTKVFNQ